MLNRRSAITAGILTAALPGLSLAQSSTERDNLKSLQSLIQDVVEGGDVSVIPTLMAEDASLPDYDVTGIETFIAISSSNHADRQHDYETYSFEIQAITAVDEWALAYVRFVGTRATGEAEDVPGFYAARFNDDGLITEIYLGT